MTVRVVDPVILPKAAWIVVTPPLLPAAVEPLMVATAVSDEVHVASFEHVNFLG